MSLTTRVRRGLAGTLAAALAASGVIALAAPSQAAEPITNASLTWNLNDEQGGGAFFGGCNFLSAGTAGNTGSSRLWTKTDPFYKAAEGNVRIEKPGRTSPWVTPIWETKCLDKTGAAVVATNTASKTENRVRFSAGTGSYNPDGSGTITWTGSFTSAFYGGMTYWTASNPTLVVTPDGNATLTADLSGYGSSMADSTVWLPLVPRNDQVIGTFTGVVITAQGFTSATPTYLGVTVDTTMPDSTPGTPQSVPGSANRGSFPQQFVDFQKLTGQSSYWYSSGGARDAAKPTGPIALTFGTPAALPADTVPGAAPVTPAPAPVVVKAATAKPTVKVSKRPTSKKAGKATVTVKSSGSSAKPTGKVKITLTKGKTTKNMSVTLKNGKSTVKLPKLKKGTWKLKVTYAGSTTQRPSTSKTYTVKSSK
ncbi:MAG: Ig-like domain repeat protein [Aeromicrobium sp.]